MATRRDQTTLNALRAKAPERAGEPDLAIDFRQPDETDQNGSNTSNGKAKSDAPPIDSAIDSAVEVERFFDLTLYELGALRTRAEVEAIEQATDLIIECEAKGGRVHVTGIGKSEHVARYIASLLSSTGTPAYFLHATECIHGSAGQVRSEDVTIAVSNSGSTPELMSAISTLHGLGTKIIGVSGNRQSPLASVSDVLLLVDVAEEGGLINIVPRASILGKIFILCGLSISLETRKGQRRTEILIRHPGPGPVSSE